ncbi:MAG: phytanoyl-CoA dioxygenase family protein [Pseudomonadota bacterium]
MAPSQALELPDQLRPTNPLGSYGAAADDLATAAEIYRENGFVVLRNAVPESALQTMEAELTEAQARLTAGELDPYYGSDLLDEPGATLNGKPFRHYVIYCTDLSAAARTAAEDPRMATLLHQLYGGSPWLNDYCRFGVVYQDARPDTGSHYSRIGWHSDYQANESIESWPGFAFTIHIDSTSPANGFLRVVPGSHRTDVDAARLGAQRFAAIPGEVPVYAERGDIILHDYKLWHAAARGTDDGDAGRRRHVRGGWFAGEKLPQEHGIGYFNKNAAR